jgi:hypothetical protein
MLLGLVSLWRNKPQIGRKKFTMLSYVETGKCNQEHCGRGTMLASKTIQMTTCMASVWLSANAVSSHVILRSLSANAVSRRTWLTKLLIFSVRGTACTRGLYNPHNSCDETAQAWPRRTIVHHSTREFNGNYGWIWIVNTCKFCQCNYQRKN